MEISRLISLLFPGELLETGGIHNSIYWKNNREKVGGIHNVIYKFTYLPIFGRVVGNRLQSEKMYPMRVYSKGNRVLGRTNLSLGQFFPFLDHQPCLASLRSADNMLMIAESENLSLGKFCSSSNTFLSPIPYRNIYSHCAFLH